MASPSAPPASTALSKSKKLKPRVSSIQLNILISFMEDHPQLAKACTELTAEFTRDRRTLWWAELVRRHNSQGPAYKTRAEWQQFWGAKVRVAKSKAGILSEDGRGTGGGPPRGSPLTPEEERILGILGGHSPLRRASAGTGAVCPLHASPLIPCLPHYLFYFGGRVLTVALGTVQDALFRRGGFVLSARKLRKRAAEPRMGLPRLLTSRHPSAEFSFVWIPLYQTALARDRRSDAASVQDGVPH
ncbi:hypothetical protein HPB47_018249 [Ixodes persulcatus]|uniref:Uncharacterized protein n=1 Tax=Ixodes persulcatus TaxID=34615 RepID=A0AC60QM73_IXOPE|nr:hypothetical protein HPB47_018249 [Ixodes persulcatus]